MSPLQRPLPSPLDALIFSAETALRTLSGGVHARRPSPAAACAGQAPSPVSGAPLPPLSVQSKQLSASLMRVNHVGEVCAQALYAAQSLATQDAALRSQLARAAQEEEDHLAWIEARLDTLAARPSLLNPLWYSGAFALGLVAGRAGDRWSLGFVAETERQVEQHLASHLERLPAEDTASRAIVSQMQQDEAAHADWAERSGAAPLPAPIQWLMKGAAKVMTITAHHI